MNAEDLLAEHAAMLKRMIEKLEHTRGLTGAFPHLPLLFPAFALLIAYVAIQREREVRR